MSVQLQIVGGDGRQQLNEQIIDIGRYTSGGPLGGSKKGFELKLRLRQSEGGKLETKVINCTIHGVIASDRTGDLWAIHGYVNLHFASWALRYPQLARCESGKFVGNYNTRTRKGSLMLS